MERKHLILLSLCCLCIYIANARVISSVKSTKVRRVKVPASGCNRPVIDVPPCGCRTLGYEAPYACTCDVDRRPCGCQKPVYIEPIEASLYGCGSGLPMATMYAVEMPCGCQSPEACTCGYTASAMQYPMVYELVEVPSCGCQGPCSCQPWNACGCQNSIKPCGCQPVSTCGCQGSVWANYDYLSPYEASPCRCNTPVIETCGCNVPNCGCCALQLSNPFDCLESILESCGCVIPTSDVSVCGNSACGCQSSPCGCQMSPCGCQNSPCGCQLSTCGCQNSPCGCQLSTCVCQNSPCGCQKSPCGCQNSPCACGAGCGCGCSGVSIPPLAPVVGRTKYLRQVTLQPPFI